MPVPPETNKIFVKTLADLPGHQLKQPTGRAA
jgi:hypothetical protein